jgi:hypothetical protein
MGGKEGDVEVVCRVVREVCRRLLGAEGRGVSFVLSCENWEGGRAVHGVLEDVFASYARADVVICC